MRATDYLFLVVIIGLVVGIVTLGVEDFNTMEAGNPIDIENLTSGYDNTATINSEINGSLEAFKTLGDDDASWFSKVAAGIIAIPKAVIGFPLLILSGIGMLTGMISTATNGIIPPFVAYALITLIMIMIFRRFMEFFQRARA